MIKGFFLDQAFVLGNEVKLLQGVLVSLLFGCGELVLCKGSEHGDAFEQPLVKANTEPIANNKGNTVIIILGLCHNFLKKQVGVFK